jgi:hypothetical protein
MQSPPIVAPQEWEAARLRLLVKEKELTKARDAMAAARRRMPWMWLASRPGCEGKVASGQRAIVQALTTSAPASTGAGAGVLGRRRLLPSSVAGDGRQDVEPGRPAGGA